jgi:hypothetical protein
MSIIEDAKALVPLADRGGRPWFTPPKPSPAQELLTAVGPIVADLCALGFTILPPAADAVAHVRQIETLLDEARAALPIEPWVPTDEKGREAEDPLVLPSAESSARIYEAYVRNHRFSRDRPDPDANKEGVRG